MSHNTEIKTCIKNKRIFGYMLNKFGWKISKERTAWENRYSKEIVTGQVITDQTGAVKMVVNKAGIPVVDPYYMGSDYEKFLQGYSTDVLKDAALMAGNTIMSETVDANGNILLTVEV